MCHQAFDPRLHDMLYVQPPVHSKPVRGKPVHAKPVHAKPVQGKPVRPSKPSGGRRLAGATTFEGRGGSCLQGRLRPQRAFPLRPNPFTSGVPPEAHPYDPPY